MAMVILKQKLKSGSPSATLPLICWNILALQFVKILSHRVPHPLHFVMCAIFWPSWQVKMFHDTALIFHYHLKQILTPFLKQSTFVSVS